jgi:peptidoglycan/LPS O-acetylase OafA/YrhL
MGVFTGFGWYYLMPKAVLEYAGSALSTLIFSSNFWFWLEDSYWAEPSSLKPLLHTWSLAVEEQFYIFFPVILLFFRKFFPKYVLALFIVLFLMSLQFSQFASHRYPDANFFLIPSRAWELLAGAILAKIEIDKGRMGNRLLNSILPTIGFFLVFFSIIFFYDEKHHPSFLTLIPILGTMMLIWFCKEGELITSILSSRLFVNFGLISYSLYLWHQPIFAFSKIANLQQTNFLKLFLLILIIVLSIFFYIFIEKPFRNNKIVSQKKLIYILSSFFLIIFSINLYAYLNNGDQRRFEKWQLQFMGADRGESINFAKYIITDYNRYLNKNFDFNKKRKNILIIGDSASQDFFNILKENNFLENVIISTHSIPAKYKNVTADVYEKKYRDKNNSRLGKDVIRIGDKRLNKRLEKADIIIVASCWSSDTSVDLPSLYADIKNLTQGEIFIVGTKGFSTLDSRALLKMTYPDIINMKIPSNTLNIQMECRSLFQENQDYIDLGAITCGDEYQSCPISTPNGYLISYDAMSPYKRRCQVSWISSQRK